MAMQVKLKRAYEPAEPSDGRRVLVDRLWPQGLRKRDAHVDVWLKEVAPSAELRRWFGHRSERWEAFQHQYREELKDNPALDQLRALVAEGPTTLVFGARDRARNQAVVLQALLQEDS